MASESWSSQSCPRRSCALFGEPGKGNVKPRGWIGRRRDIRLLWCTVCGGRFTERHRTALFRAKLSLERFSSVAQHLTEGCGIRATARLCQVAVKTVFRVLVRAGRQARRIHDLAVRDLHIEAIQIDEKRCAVRGSRLAPPLPPRTAPGRFRIMDDLALGRRVPTLLRLRASRWDHICIASQEKLVVSAAFGAHTAGLSDYLVADVRRRMNSGTPPQLIESDEFGGIASAVAGHWWSHRQDYVHAVVNKVREDHRVVKCIRRIAHGTPELLHQLRREHPSFPSRLNTSFVERYHLTDRGMLAFKQRLSSHLAQKPWHYDCASWLSITYYNFCRGHRMLEGRTPAQAAGVTIKRWTLKDLLSRPVSRQHMLPPPQLSDRYPPYIAAEILVSQRYSVKESVAVAGV